MTNVPRDWNDDKLKQRLFQMQRKVENSKIELKNGINSALLRVVGFREAIRVYILNEQNIDGYMVHTDIKVSQKQQHPGKPSNPSQSGGFPGMQNRTIRTITNPLPAGNNQPAPSMNSSMNPNTNQQQQMGGNRFQTNAQSFQSPDQTLKPRFGQSSHIGQSPGFG
ncbi:MAG: hypothetical protein EOP48_32160, partial [Sphingobacteriales bacterium]